MLQLGCIGSAHLCLRLSASRRRRRVSLLAGWTSAPGLIGPPRSGAHCLCAVKRVEDFSFFPTTRLLTPSKATMTMLRCTAGGRAALLGFPVRYRPSAAIERALHHRDRSCTVPGVPIQVRDALAGRPAPSGVAARTGAPDGSGWEGRHLGKKCWGTAAPAQTVSHHHRVSSMWGCAPACAGKKGGPACSWQALRAVFRGVALLTVFAEAWTASPRGATPSLWCCLYANPRWPRTAWRHTAEPSPAGRGRLRCKRVPAVSAHRPSPCRSRLAATALARQPWVP